MIKKVFAYYWDFQKKRIDKLEAEATHPYAKVQNKVDAGRLERKRWVFPFRKKSVYYSSKTQEET